MISASKRLLFAVASVLLLSAVFTTSASAQDGGTVYRANLVELNDSGASGSGSLTVSDDGRTMQVQINASGLDLDGPHAMHIHAIVDGDTVSASTCPTMADDADGDGVLTVAEGAPKYGGVQVSLTTTGDSSADSALAVDRFPAGTSISYNRPGIPIPDALQGELSKVHFVVHGIDENGNGTLDMDQTERSSLTDDLPREATAPALCGTLTVQAQGPVQTGAGGLAGDESTTKTVTIAGLGIAAIAASAAALVARRRS